SRSCAARPTSTSAPDAVARRPRLAVTLGDPRGIGPEVVARALASGPLDAEVTVIGADDQVGDLRADAKVGIGVWNAGRGEKGEVPSADRSVAVRRSEPLPSPFSPEALAGRLAEAALRVWWGIAQPRLAVCALNPHAGDSGLFGDEDDRVLRPAAEALAAAGPLSADTVFVRALRGEFDAVLTPYHDVGMTA